MSDPQSRRFKTTKLKLRLLDVLDSDTDTDTDIAAPPHLPLNTHPTPSPPTIPPAVPPTQPLYPPSTAALTFSQYQSARHTSIDDQFSFIARLRAEISAAERDAIDEDLLRDMAKQLALCVFPTAKMMQIDPGKVKKMMDEEFMRAYGLDNANEQKREAPARKGLDESDAGAGDVLREKVAGVRVDEVVTDEGIGVLVGVEGHAQYGRLEGEPPKKKAKIVQTDVRKEVKAYQTRRKRGRRPCRVVTLRSELASQAWEEMIHGRV
ncbi:Nn.00g084380.m01.CDS01 [Neocucurbitaria sp. VM-36]